MLVHTPHERPRDCCATDSESPCAEDDVAACHLCMGGCGDFIALRNASSTQYKSSHRWCQTDTEAKVADEFTLYAFSSCAANVTLSVEIAAVRSQESVDYCAARVAAADRLVAIIVASLIAIACLTCCFSLCNSDFARSRVRLAKEAVP